ncbi:MAG: LuxR C-terminal-related transcriptional regulator [Methylobacter sp.]|nr:LuxR C-terminal-related transcriptional regulator [Methylobacter sp.]
MITTIEELEKTKGETAEVNTALDVMLKRRITEKTNAQLVLSREVESTILPFLKKLKGASAGCLQSTQPIEIIEANLQHLIIDYGQADNLPAAYQKLSPVEVLVASMVRQGLPTKVIAATLNISSGTVCIHHKHIRKKLNLDGKSSNLHSYLAALAK